MTTITATHPVAYFMPSGSYSEPVPSGMMRFQYRWTYRPTNKQGTSYVYTYTHGAFLVLIAHWNAQSIEWDYSTA